MKKIVLLALITLLVVSFLPAQQTGRLTVWSFTDELDNMINNYFRPSRPQVQVTYSMIPTEQFASRLDAVLLSGRGAPDVFALESSFVRRYVESGLLLDLTDIYEANRAKLMSYPVEIGTHNGRVYALSWHACPGAMFYRRSLARRYLGTDDPAAVQAFFTDMTKFLETARLLKARSNGACVVVSSLGDLFQPFLSTRTQPWVVNGRLVIDPAVEQYMDIAKTLRDNQLEGRVGQWSEGWFAGMNNNLRDSNGRQLEVFAYFLPTWGLHYVLKPNAFETAGDWAMIQGPVAYRWGGTWLAAARNTPNAAAARDMIRYLITDDNFLESYAIASGVLVSNTNVVNRIRNNYREPFLGGQNHYAAFADMAANVNVRLVQGTDDHIQALFQMLVLDAYVLGEKTKQQALADFRSWVAEELNIR
ncbi:MAG: ABC transporter substrate-binding protein [Treponema sp.]|nr:ABC transporter substrate-binding protein [Treponema sp.]